MRVVGQGTFAKPRETSASQVRSSPIFSLLSGESYGLLSEHLFAFEDRPSFGPAMSTKHAPDPAEWVARQIENTAAHVSQANANERPIIISTPQAALTHPNTALASDAAVRRTDMCHQEICLEFSDTTFMGEPADMIQKIAKLKRRGFRIGIDMRTSWNSTIGQSLGLLLDTIRVDAQEVCRNTTLSEITFAARHAGVFVIAENAKWRDGEYLESLGVLGAVRPQTDS